MLGKKVSHYRILEKLGGGGMGVVYKAEDTKLHRFVALKFLPEALTKDRQALERFQREAQAASALNHPNICTIHEINEHEGQPFIVMEFIQGCTLRRIAGRQFSFEPLAQLSGQVAKALAVAHATGIIHRDIKPENLMLRDDGLLKVLDFGLARLIPKSLAQSVAETAGGTDAGTLLGTIRYMSPEQARGEAVSSATDIFSLGIVLYELATGQHPFKAGSQLSILHAIVSEHPSPPSQHNPEIPAPLEALILRMLEKDARLRPSVAEVEAILAALARKPAELATPAAILATKRHTVGREKERGQLRAGFESAVGGRGLLLCISGEPGIGKTTLVEGFLAELQAGGPLCCVARGRCSERLAGTEAYLPLLEALESLLHSQADGGVARLMKLAAPSWYAQVVPLSAEDSSSERSLRGVKAASQERMKRELGTFFQEVARVRTLVLFFDDLHWADVSTVDLIAYLATKFESTRLLMVVTYRPSDLLLSKHPFLPVKLDLQARGLCREIGLEFLTREDIQHYLALEFSNHRLPAEFPALIYSKTEGSPLFMVDLVRYLRDRCVIAEEQSRWTLTQPIPDVERELPESVRSMIERKMDQLSEADRRLLVAASVQGHEFDSAVVSRAAELGPTEVEERLEILDRVHAFVRVIGEREFPGRTLTRRYRFVHILYQNAFYASMGPARKGSLSAAVAQALLNHYGERSSEIASELAFLFEAARDFARASEYFLLGAQNAARVFANREAILLGERGLEMLKALPDGLERARRELRLRLAMGVPLSEIKGYSTPEVEQNYTRARELCQQSGDTHELFTVLTGLWGFYLVRAELERARQTAEELLRIAQNRPEALLLIEAHRAMGHTLGRLGENVPALEHHDKVVALYDPGGHASHAVLFHGLDPGVTCRSFGAELLWKVGYPEAALARAQDGLTLATELSHPHSLSYAHCFCAFVHHFRRDLPRTREHAETLTAICSDHGIPIFLAYGRVLRGWVAAIEGRCEDGIEQMRSALAEYGCAGGVLCIPWFLVLLAEAYGERNRAEEGLSAVAEALAVADKTGNHDHTSEAYRLKGELRLMQSAKNAPEAEACFRQAIEFARRQSAKSFELRAVMSLSRLYQKQGRKEEARHMLAEIYGWFTEGFDTADLREAKALLHEL